MTWPSYIVFVVWTSPGGPSLHIRFYAWSYTTINNCNTGISLVFYRCIMMPYGFVWTNSLGCWLDNLSGDSNRNGNRNQNIGVGKNGNRNGNRNYGGENGNGNGNVGIGDNGNNNGNLNRGDGSHRNMNSVSLGVGKLIICCFSSISCRLQHPRNVLPCSKGAWISRFCNSACKDMWERILFSQCLFTWLTAKQSWLRSWMK